MPSISAAKGVFVVLTIVLFGWLLFLGERPDTSTGEAPNIVPPTGTSTDTTSPGPQDPTDTHQPPSDTHTTDPTPNPVACTMEAKLCPDGSAVGRTGPNCEFAPCPTFTTPTTLGTQLGESITIDGITISPLEVVEDSRCSPTLQCVWEGRVVVRTQLENGGNAKLVSFEVNVPVSFAGKSVTLTDVQPPYRNPDDATLPAYAFVFSIQATTGTQDIDDTTSTHPLMSVAGEVLLGPTCPVVRAGDTSCADKPYQTTVYVYAGTDTTTDPVSAQQTKEDGTFLLELPIGTYTLVPQGGQPLPHCAPYTLTVTEDMPEAIITLSCDTGIR